MNYTDEQLKAMDKESASAALANAVYTAALLLERLEAVGKVHGNGHHMAQKIATQAETLLHERWIEQEGE